MIKITKENIENFDMRSERVETSDKPQKIPVSFFNRIPQLPFEAIKGTFDNIAIKQLKVIADSSYYGIPLLHLCTLNKDPRILDYITSLFVKYNIALNNTAINNTGTNKFEFSVGETPMNVAYRQASLEKIKVLYNCGLVDMNTELGIKAINSRRITCSNLLEMACIYSLGNKKEINFYLNFALSVKSFKSYFKDSQKRQKNVGLYKVLLTCPRMYDDEFFRENIGEIITSNFLSSHTYSFEVEKDKIPTIDNIISFTPGVLLNQNVYDSVLGAIPHYYTELKNHYQEKLLITKERASLNSTVTPSTQNKIIKI